MDDIKYICVGNPKTGTSSLLKAFQILEYKCASYDLEKALNHIMEEEDVLVNQAKDFNFLKDWPCRFLYKEIDQRYENCKFILTIRDEEKWVNSYTNHVSSEIPDSITNRYRLKTLGINPREYLHDKEFLIENVYRKNNQDVLDYFKYRPNDLFIIDITKENKWDSLCKFLKKPIPNEKFPHENKGMD